MLNSMLRLHRSTGLGAKSTARAFSSLVDSTWLQDKISSNADNIIPVDCKQEDSFLEGHIPTALSLDVGATGLKDQDPPGTSIMKKEHFQEYVDELRLNPRHTLVFYDDAFGVKAARAWWVFRYFGFPKEQLKILDGGWNKWMADTNDVSSESESFPASADPIWSPHEGKDLVMDLDGLKEAIEDENWQIVDTRSEGEYNGSAAYNKHAGHVPRAIHYEWTEALDVANLGVFKDTSELQTRLVEELGLEKDKPVVTYCQRAIRAAHTAFVLEELLGFQDVRVYEGSMIEYLNRDDTAVEK